MIATPKNRVQAIKSKFERLNKENTLKFEHLNKQNSYYNIQTDIVKENGACNIQYNQKAPEPDTESSSDSWTAEPNTSYLYTQNELVKPLSESKKSLTRQTSDPGKKLHRSHAFRCDRSKIISPKRHGSCYGRPETSGFALNMEKKLPKDKLRKLSNFIEDQMRKDMVVQAGNKNIVGQVLEVNSIPKNSIPDSDVPKHILDQYAKVNKQKNIELERKELTTDSGVSSETEELKNVFEEEKSDVKRLTSQFENPEHNLNAMNELCASSETIKLERKNPNLVLTSTLKKALKQPLPPGPPPKKPPRTFVITVHEEKEKAPERDRKDAKKMLEKLEQVLQKRESNTLKTEIAIQKEPKEIHYLCTEILDITQRTLLPNSVNNCFKSLNCAINNSTLSLPYTHLNDRRSLLCSCSTDNINQPHSSLESKCVRCQVNSQRENEFKCHLHCKCKTENSQFYVENEHIYDEPCVEEVKRLNHYGTLNHSRSMEELRNIYEDDQKIYDIPCDISRSATPEARTPSPPPKTSSPTPKTQPQVSKPSESFKTLEVPQKPALERLKCIFENPEKTETDNESPKIEISHKTDFQKLKQSFENPNKMEILKEDTKSGNQPKPELGAKKFATTKPPTKPKPLIARLNSKSIENLSDPKLNDAKCMENMNRDGGTSRFSIENMNQGDGTSRFSTENRNQDGKTSRFSKENRNQDGGTSRFPMENRNQYGSTSRRSPLRKDTTQLDVDRENLNQLMTELYETVAVACSMAADTPGKFPAETSQTNSEDSVKLTRSLTEKRKNYVRRVSSRVAYLETKNVKHIRSRHQTSICTYRPDNTETTYNTFRSWKSFRTSQNNLTNNMEVDSPLKEYPKKSLTNAEDRISIDGKTGCVDIGLPFDPRERGLFNVCLLAGLNYLTGEAYVKSVFPAQVQVPAHIENLIFPETMTSSPDGQWSADAKSTQCYSLVLTDERGERAYGYCRRVLPEGASVCLPLCYCLIGKYRAPGFYYKVLEEIESHHGRSEQEMQSILQQLFESDFPSPGEHIIINSHTTYHKHQIDNKKCKTMPDMRRSDNFVYKSDMEKSDLVKSDLLDKSDSDYSDSFSGSHVFLDLEGPRMKLIKRVIEPRADEHNLSVLLDSLGAGLTVKVFSCLLLERKVLVCGDKLSQVSSCMEALQMSLYPFVWQQPLISTVPSEIEREVLEAPLPMLAGVLLTSGQLDTTGVTFEEGMLIDLSQTSKVLFCQGDEATILPTASFKTLKTALQMEYKRDRFEDAKTRNVMISEAFLRFFVDILGDFRKHFSVGELKEGDFGKGNIIFDKESFVRNSASKQNQYFLEWFTETAMFNHFITNMAACQHDSCQTDVELSKRLVDAPLPNFYDLFNERMKSRTKTEGNKFDKSNYKSALNKRMKLLKTKLKELVA